MIIVNDAKNTHNTFPLIFQNGRFIGGYNELYGIITTSYTIVS